MREDIYQWMKSLAVFYLFFTAVLQLVPDRNMNAMCVRLRDFF